MPGNRKQSHGFTLIETLIAVGIMAIFLTAVGSIVKNVLTTITVSRIRTTAVSMATAKMELIHNLPYTDVGTLGGIPQGVLSPTETVTVNNLIFTIQTSVIFIDDPYDGVSPADTSNTDYKRASVSVSWGGSYPSGTPVTHVTNISSKSKESAVSGGTIKVTVYNSFGQPVGGASVTIDNTSIVPPIHTTNLTDSSGQLLLPGAPPCNTCYRVSAQKTNYSTQRTYATTEVANPDIPDVTVLDRQLSQVSFAIDMVSSVTVNSYSSSYTPVSNVQFTIRGAKIIGYDANDQPVYKYQYATNTGGFTVSIPALEWDTYTIDLSNSAYTLAGSNPVIPFPHTAGSPQTMQLVVVPKAQASLLVLVKDPFGQPLASASARLIQPSIPFDTTGFTHATGSADFGQFFFPNIALNTYDLFVGLPGYTDASASVTINGNIQQTMLIAPL